MKHAVHLAVLAAALALLSGCGHICRHPCEHSAPVAPPPRTLADARSWCLYYGASTTDIVERLGGYDLVVIDAKALGGTASNTIARLKSKGCLVAGYLSMFEVARWHRYRSRIPREWYLTVDGKPWSPWAGKDVSWDDNLVASFAEPGWREMLVGLVKSEVLDYGCDGVFMDTLEDLDFATLPAAERPRQLEGMRQLLAALDETYPKAFFIANRTLQGTLPVAAPYLDALCWESFAPKYFEDPPTRAWMDGVSRNIEAQREKYPFVKLSLMDSDKSAADIPTTQAKMRAISAERGYVPYCTVGGYSALPPLPTK